MSEVTNQKESHWFRNLMLIIIIGLLIWQYITPIFMDIERPTDYINEFINPDNSKAYWQIYIIDQITGVETLYNLNGTQIGAIYQMEKFKTYDIGMQATNLQGSLFGTYKFNFIVEVLSTGNQTPVSMQIPSYTFYMKNRISIPQDIYLANYERSDSITFNFINPEGIYLSHYSNNVKSFSLGLDKAIP